VSCEFLDRLSPRDRALFDGLSNEDALAVFAYLFPQGTGARLPLGMRPRAIALYDPLCDRRRYGLGLLWQASPYTGCDHGCAYCYGRSYLLRFGGGGRPKPGFQRAVSRDLEDMHRLGVPRRHLSMANSSDVLQARLEREHRLALQLFEELVRNRALFSTFGILTKNPAVLFDDERYVAALLALDAEVQVSICFFGDETAARLEPGAPAPSERRAATERLAAAGVRVVLRLDPLFPRGVDGCPDLQTVDGDLRPLIQWAASLPVEYVITSPMKLPFRRNRVEDFHHSIAGAFPIVRGFYRRMEPDAQRRLVEDVRALGSALGLRVEHCFTNILKRHPGGSAGSPS
jgi:DNA repair photolyase